MAYIVFSLLLAAATLGVPVAVFPSCTPKGMMVRPSTCQPIKPHHVMPHAWARALGNVVDSLSWFPCPGRTLYLRSGRLGHVS